MRQALTILLPALLTIAAAGGFCQQEIDEPQPDVEQGEVVVAKAIWPDHDLGGAVYRVFADPNMRELVDSFPAGGSEGTGLLVLRPGEYYVMVVVDANDNNRPDVGDGLGFYGVDSISGNPRPTPLTVEKNSVATIVIPILLQLSTEGRPEPLPWALAQTRGTLVGSVTEAGDRPVVVVALPVAEDGASFATLARPDGAFALRAAPGAYRLIAIADSNGDERASAGDLIAMRGWGDEEPTTVTMDAELAIGELVLSAGEVPEGLPPIVAGEVTGAKLPVGAAVKVSFCADAAMQVEVSSAQGSSDGRFAATPQAATYYLRVTVDREDDGRLGSGDMVGFYGVEDLGAEDDAPEPLPVAPDALLTGVEIPIAATIGENGRLRPYRQAPAAEPNAEADAAGE